MPINTQEAYITTYRWDQKWNSPIT
jgi:hypothetical protein